jgi:hypothetical protein
MLIPYRRYFAVLAFLLLATPLVAGIILPVSPAAILKEGRKLAPAPRAPATRPDSLRHSKQVDAYLQDHLSRRFRSSEIWRVPLQIASVVRPAKSKPARRSATMP